MRLRIAGFIAAALLGACPSAHAETYPRQFLARTHGAPFPGGADALAAFLPKEIEKWKELARVANIQPQ